MKRPVRIIKHPKAQSGFEIKMNPGMGFNANQLSWPVMAGEFSAPETEVNDTLKPTDWDQANLEAEKGETVVTNLNYDGIPEHYKIGGKRHYEGGTPLNLPPNSFIFSRDRSMRIKDEEILKIFNMKPTKKGYTPADIAKQYDINKYRRILADPDTEDLQRETAEMMISNYNMKLGKLALVQESLKGFPQGIPMIAMPYIQTAGLNPEQFTQTQAQPDETGEEDQARYGKQVRRLPRKLNGGTEPNNPFADTDGNGLPDYLQTNLSKEGTSPGLSTTGGGSGSITVKRKGLGLGDMFANPIGAMETFMGAEKLLTNVFNKDERNAAEARIANQRSANNLFQHTGGSDMGDYVKDTYAGAHFRPHMTGQQFLADSAVGNMPGYNIGFTKYGGEGDLPQARFGMFGNRGGFFGPRSRMVGMRYNPSTGVYEAVNRRGEVIGFFRAGQGQGGVGQGGMMNTGSYTTGSGSSGGGSSSENTTTTTTKKKVKKQVIPDNAKVISRKDYDSDEAYNKARDEAFAEAGGKYKVYTQDKDGKYYTVGEAPMFEGNKDVDAQLAYLKEQFSDPKMAKLLREKMIAASNDSNKLKKNKTEIQQMLNDKNITDQQFVDQFLEMNTRNRKVNDLIQGAYDCYDNASGKWIKNKKGCDQKIGDKYPSLEDAAKAAGVPMGDAKTKALQQLSYIGYDDMLKDRDTGKITDEDVLKKLKNFQITQFGVADEDIGSGKAKISPADAAYTNTTTGQVAGITGKKRIEDLLKEEEFDEETTNTEKKKQEEYARQPQNAPWWLQDIVKSGKAFGDWAGIQKYMPWAPTPNVTLPEATYYDPNRQLAANAEASANIIQNLGAFQGPQSLSSRASQIFGQTAKGAADTLAQYNNMNVGVANNMALQRANLLNQNAIQRTGIAKQLYDENTMANQQFDNAKAMATENMVNQWVSGKTNAMNTYNLNQMYPQYHVHPEFGGPISFEGGRPVKPDVSGKAGYMDKYTEYKKRLPAGTSDEVIWNLVKADMSTDGGQEVDPDYMKAWQATAQGMGNPMHSYGNQ